MNRVRWGVLSTAKIGTQKVIPALQRAANCEVAAVASRELPAAQAVAQALGIPQAYGSYEALLNDPHIDAVYIPLPNHLHVPWSIRALEAGKHVLCEKPIGLTASEGENLLTAAACFPKLKVMEAFMYRHHPQWQRTKQLIDEGAIGSVRAIQAAFSYCNVDPANIRNKADLGGGGLMDIGCYCISLSRWIFDSEPQRVCAWLDQDPNFGTDRLASALLDFGSGTAAFTCSTQLVPYQRVNILGTAGRIEIEIPFNAPPDRPCRIWHGQGGEPTEIAFPLCDQYTIQGELFADAILQDHPVPTPLRDAIDNMRVLEATTLSAMLGQWVQP